MHLTAGSLAGVVVLVMCVTGVALTYEKQVLEWADSRSWSAPPSAGASHLPPETLLAKVRQAQPGAAPTGLSMRADPQAPATLTLEGNQSLLVDPYTGTVIGPPPQGVARVLSRRDQLASLPRARRRAAGPPGVCSPAPPISLFFFIVISGMYLWIPKTLSWLQVSRVVWFRRGLPVRRHAISTGTTSSASGARFPWPSWSPAPFRSPIAWGNALVYRLVGEEPPPPPAARPRPGDSGWRQPLRRRPRPAGRWRSPESLGRSSPEIRLDGLDAAWARALAEVPAWRTITIRFSPNPQSPWVFTVDSGYGGQPQKRQTLTIDRTSSAVLKIRSFRKPDARPPRALVAAFRPYRRVLWIDRTDDCRRRRPRAVPSSSTPVFRWLSGDSSRGSAAVKSSTRDQRQAA